MSEEDGPRTAFSTLCTPSSLGKRLPMVLHNGDKCLYEEPCLLAFDLYVGEVRQLDACCFRTICCAPAVTMPS